GKGVTVATTWVRGPSQLAALVHETQYDVVMLIGGVVKFVPVNNKLPPVAASYHLRVPVQFEAVKLTVPVPHREFGPAVGASGIGFTVITTVDVTAGHGPGGSLVVRVRVTVPLRTLGVYVEISEFGFENVPLGAVQVPVVAPPPTEPLKLIVPPAHTGCGLPALAVATGLIVIVTVDNTAGHGPVGSSVVKVNVTNPAATSAALGVYTASGLLAFGLKDPVPPVHVDVVAPPPILPPNATEEPAHIVCAVPAFTIAFGLTVII